MTATGTTNARNNNAAAGTSVQTQCTNDYDISSSDDDKHEKKEQSFHIDCQRTDEVLNHNDDLDNDFFQQPDYCTDDLLQSSPKCNSVIGTDNLLQSSANCNTEKELDRDTMSHENISIHPQARKRKRKITTRRRNSLSVKEALKQGEGSIHTWGGEKFKRLYPTLNCNSCCFSGYHLIIVCNEAYNSNCENTNADMKTKILSCFVYSTCSLSLTENGKIGKSRTVYVKKFEDQHKKGCEYFSWP